MSDEYFKKYSSALNYIKKYDDAPELFYGIYKKAIDLNYFKGHHICERNRKPTEQIEIYSIAHTRGPIGFPQEIKVMVIL